MIALLAVSVNALAQSQHKKEKSNISKSFSDDGKTLQIKITGKQGEKSVDFERKYNIQNLSKAQVDSIKQHVIDSLGVN